MLLVGGLAGVASAASGRAPKAEPVVVPRPWRMSASGERVAVGEASVSFGRGLDPRVKRELQALIAEKAGQKGAAAPSPRTRIICAKQSPRVEETLRRLGFRVPWRQLGDQGYALSISRGQRENLVLLTGLTDQGIFYGLQTLRQLFEPGRPPTLPVVRLLDRPAFPERAFIYSHLSLEVMTGLLDHAKRLKFNVHWDLTPRGPQVVEGKGGLLPPEERQQLIKRLLAADRERFILYVAMDGYAGFGNKTWYSDEDLKLAQRYFEARYQLGVRAFEIGFDDLPIRTPGSGELAVRNQLRVVEAVRRQFARGHEPVRLYFCPTPYAGVPGGRFVFSATKEASDYLARLKRELPRDLPVMWTGRGVFSPTITAAQARAYGGLIGRKPYIWDNDPIHWANEVRPLSGRSPDLYRATAGHLSNLVHGTKSLDDVKLIMITIADYLWNPEAYDPGKAMARAADMR
jgi:hyaluronoglucosaminidase